jgi:hypothetical protein
MYSHYKLNSVFGFVFIIKENKHAIEFSYLNIFIIIIINCLLA